VSLFILGGIKETVSGSS